MTTSGPVVRIAEPLVRDAGDLVEGPRWDERTSRLHWVDVTGGRWHNSDADGGEHRVRDVGEAIGCVTPCRDGSAWLLALRSGIHRCSDEGGVAERVSGPPPGGPGTRFNDGWADPSGRLLVGSMADDQHAGGGALLRLDVATGRLEPVIEPTTVSNGIGFSADGRRMYYVDSRERSLDLLDHDPVSGSLTGRRALVEFGAADGTPDGLVVDADDHVWVALWDGGEVRRFDPHGTHVATVRCPLPRISSATFGGPDLDVLFITSAADDQHPTGTVLRAEPGVRGRPVARADS